MNRCDRSAGIWITYLFLYCQSQFEWPKIAGSWSHSFQLTSTFFLQPRHFHIRRISRTVCQSAKFFWKFFRPEKWLEIQGRVDCKLCKDPLASRQMQEEELRQIYKRKAVDIFANGKMQRVWWENVRSETGCKKENGEKFGSWKWIEKRLLKDQNWEKTTKRAEKKALDVTVPFPERSHDLSPPFMISGGSA